MKIKTLFIKSQVQFSNLCVKVKSLLLILLRAIHLHPVHEILKIFHKLGHIYLLETIISSLWRHLTVYRHNFI